MSIPFVPIRYNAIAMELATALDKEYVEMNILTDVGKTITVVCDKDAIFSVQRDAGQIDRAYPETSTIHKGKIAMYECAARLPQLLVTWVLVANGKQAEIYEYHKTKQKIPSGEPVQHHDEKSDYKLMPVLNGLIETESIEDYQIGHDRRTKVSNSPLGDACAPYGEIKEELKRRFIKTIASKLQLAGAANLFDRLILVSPAKMIRELRGQLDPDVQNRIVAILPKDLTYYHSQVLMTQLRNVLAEAHVD